MHQTQVYIKHMRRGTRKSQKACSKLTCSKWSAPTKNLRSFQHQVRVLQGSTVHVALQVLKPLVLLRAAGDKRPGCPLSLSSPALLLFPRFGAIKDQVSSLPRSIQAATAVASDEVHGACCALYSFPYPDAELEFAHCDRWKMDDGGQYSVEPDRNPEESVGDYRASVEAAMEINMEEALAGFENEVSDGEARHKMLDLHHHHHDPDDPDGLATIDLSHVVQRDSESDNLGFDSTIEVSGDGDFGGQRGVVIDRDQFSLLEEGSGDVVELGFDEERVDESVRKFTDDIEDTADAGALMHSLGEVFTESDLESDDQERVERQAVFGALAAAAAAVNVALQSISGAGCIAINTTEDSSLENRTFKKRKRKNEEETDFIPAVLNTVADAEAVASLSVSESSSPKKDAFVFDDIDWFLKPRSKRWWRRLFRVSKPTFDYICQLVKPDVESETPASFQGIEGRVITVEKQVAIALRRLASGDSLTTLGELFGVGESTVSKVIWKFVNSMEKRARHHMNWPEGAEMERVKCGFEVDHGLPNCCGVIDVTHILMELPGTESSVDWFDREQNYSMLMQVVVDMDMRIRDIFTGWPGSITDSRLLRNSGFYAMCENGERLHGQPRMVQGIQVREYIIGDSGYPLLPWLINPYTTTGLSPSRDYFNVKHASTKSVVEDALGRLKGAWKILHKVLWRPDIRKLPSIILVCCLLHNIMIEAGEEIEDGVALVGHHDEGYRQQWCLSVEPEGHLIREALAEHVFMNEHQ
ncbi:hypothetical protein R1sor_023813 [Riccia sorocarpa]|uniref:DDE Tnp4 domain-containing protein n=1 Tax=Riccia sorocarpa TaxID=122646 RepID=A0ABD3GRR2_9MARC